MNTVFNLWGMVPGQADYRSLYEAGRAAGQGLIADLFHPDRVVETRRLTGWFALTGPDRCNLPARGGLRLSWAAAIAAGEKLDGCGVLILVGLPPQKSVERHLARWRQKVAFVAWEYAPHAKIPCDPIHLDGIVIRGYESGGVSRDQSVLTLFNLACRSLPGALPLIVQGLENPELAAVFKLAGAQGFILDSSLLLLPEAGVPEAAAKEMRQARESGLRRRYLGAGWVEVSYVCSGAGDNIEVPAGMSLIIAGDSAAQDIGARMAGFRQAVNGALSDLETVKTAELLELQAEPFAMQGPMAWISNSPPFAEACARGGFFPVLSLLGLDRGAIGALAKGIAEKRAIKSFGIGIAGKNELAPAETIAAFGKKPPTAIILAADQWIMRKEWHALPIPAWIHVQTRAMLEIALADSPHRFILEGCESGGRVGYLSSVALWTLAFKTLRDKRIATDGVRLVLAGGIADGGTTLMGLLLARAFGFTGKIAVQVGTPLLMTDEAVASGAVHRAYRDVLLKASLARVIGAPTGIGVKVAATPAVERQLRAARRKTPDEGKLFAAYGRALRGARNGLVIGGESLAYIEHPIGMTALARDLHRGPALWPEWRERIEHVETLDFSILRRRPLLDIAVVGIGCIFPGAADSREFWTNIAGNKRQFSEIPPEYWGAGNFRDSVASRKNGEAKTYTWFAGRVKGFVFDKFDCLKFHISPRTVAATDRIHLMLLKALDQAVQSAGPAFRCPSEETAVFVGNSMGGELVKRGVLRTHAEEIAGILGNLPEYRGLPDTTRSAIARGLKEQLCRGLPELSEDMLIGIASSTLAGRLAGYLDVYGANCNVDAACASSLAALAMAAQQLRDGLCRCAVAGAVDSDLTVDTFINFCKLHALATTISRPFMEGSDGFTMGEGTGVLLLKPLPQALADGDPVFARVVGIGMSSDGNQGTMTLPSAEGQRLAIQRAFDMSGFEPASVGFIEAHGTGTEVGDRVELEVLRRIFDGAPPRSIALGAVKAHIGHLKSAAGMAALIKTILALHHRVIPPSWIEGTPRAELRDVRSAFRLPAKAGPWRRRGVLPRRAVVSSFGFGGSNYHVHLEEMDEGLRRMTPSRLLLFAGRDRAEVAARCAGWRDAVVAAGQVDFFDVAQLRWLGGDGPARLAATWHTGATSWPQAWAAIGAALAGQPSDMARFSGTCSRQPIAFLFPGQGSLAGAPFRQFIATVPSFAIDLRRYARMTGQPFAKIWQGTQAPGPKITSRNDLMQAATTALSLSLARLLRAVGIVPDAVAGHSLGHYTVLAASGMLSDETVLGLVRRRVACCEAMRTRDGGCMFAVTVDEHAARALAESAPHPVYPANFNSPNQTVFALARRHAKAIGLFLDERGIEWSRLPVTWGYHSPFVEPAGRAYLCHLRRCRFLHPHVRIYSETAGGPVQTVGPACPPWLRIHIYHPVQFSRMARAMRADGYRHFLEVGGRGTLSRFVRDTLGKGDYHCLTMDSTAADHVEHFHGVLAALFLDAGQVIDVGTYTRIFAAHLRPVGIGHDVVRLSTGTVRADTPPDGAPVGETAGDGGAEDPAFRTIRAIIARHSGFDEKLITRDKLVRGALGIDSLKMVEIVLEIEKQTGVSLAGAQLPQSLTVGKLADYVASQSGHVAPEAAAAPISRHKITWREVDRPAVKPPRKGAIALIAGEKALVEAWRAAGYGPAWGIEPDDRVALEKVMADLRTRSFEGLVCCPAVRDEGDAGVALRDAFVPVLTLAREYVAQRNSDGEGRFRFYTAALSRGAEPGIAAGLRGFARSMQWETPQIRCGHVDILGLGDPVACAAILAGEAADHDDPFQVVRHAGGRRLVEQLEPCAANAGSSLVQSDDVILVTGGGHGITAAVVEGLAADSKASWIIVGKTDIEQDNPKARAVAAMLKRLHDAGKKAEYRRCDLADAAQVRVLAAELAGRTPRITGIIHGAGVLADAGLENKTQDDFMRVVQIKAGAALAIERALAPGAIRFWINFSSITSLFGNHGQTDYAAANAILDDQAVRLAESGISLARSILWSPWQEVGMAADARLQAVIKARGITAITPAEGVAWMRSEFSMRDSPLICLVGDPAKAGAPMPVTGSAAWEKRVTVGATCDYRSRRFDTKFRFLGDHVIKGAPILPGAMVFDLTAQCAPPDAAVLTWERVVFNHIMRCHDGGLTIAMRWYAEVGGARFDGCDAERPAEPGFEGRILWNHADRLSLKAPAARDMKRLPDDRLYGLDGLLFSGPLFQVVRGVEIGRGVLTAGLARFDPAVYDSLTAAARAPLTWIDGLFQMAAVFCMERGFGLYLPAGAERLQWLTGGTLNEATATVWCDAPVEGGAQIHFNAVIWRGNDVILSAQRFAMNRMGD